jgi:hypothetical protein
MRIQNFFALDQQHKTLFIQAYFLLAYLRVAMIRRPFKKLVRDLELHRDPVQLMELSAEDRVTADAVGWAVRTAANFTPWESACLVQVLVAQKMLRSRNIPGAFYLGATTGLEEGDGDMAAHAWLKCGTQFITGEQGHQQYTVVSCFSWT